ncbi:MAG: hypothetical protein E4H41_07105 [Gemmatimonadales bacterium]|nr:MAG: hypothetical protein E4H41_07105 [Gemmatimonadales bacterium]
MNPLRIFTAVMGFLAAALAIARDDTTLVWIAIGLLGSSAGVRILQKLQSKREQDDTDPSDRDG